MHRTYCQTVSQFFFCPGRFFSRLPVSLPGQPHPRPFPVCFRRFPRRIPGQAEPFRTLRHRQNVAITLRIKPYRRLYLLPRERQTAPFGVSDKVICDPQSSAVWRAEAESLRPESLKKRPGLPLMLLFFFLCCHKSSRQKNFSQSARSVGNGERGRNLLCSREALGKRQRVRQLTSVGFGAKP